MKQRSHRLLSGARKCLAIFAPALFSVAATASDNFTKSIAIVGPIEALNCTDESFKILGLQFRASEDYLLAEMCESSDDSLQYVAIAGFKDERGELVATHVSSLGVRYVPGVSLVYIAGEVSDSKVDVGLFAVSGSTTISIPGVAPGVGERIEAIGSQPQPGGAVVAVSMQPVGSAVTPDSRLKSIVESSELTSRIVGSRISTSGIVGSGVSTNGIVGSGVRTSGIVGSGVYTEGIVGSGVRTTGIVGSGATTNGIVGSGAQTTGIVGSGSSTSGIVGSGVQTTGIVGSGVFANGIVGSGVQANGIVGSGVTTSGIVGSGVQTTGIVGSGVSMRGIVGSGIQAN